MGWRFRIMGSEIPLCWTMFSGEGDGFCRIWSQSGIFIAVLDSNYTIS